MSTLLRRCSVLLVALFGWACRHSAAGPVVSCEPAAGAPRELDMSAVSQLGGQYTVTRIATSRGGSRSTQRGTLTLARNDSVSRYFESYITRQVRRGDRVLAGTMALEGGPTDTVTANTDGLRVGACQFSYCSDAPVSTYTFVEVTPAMVRGYWSTGVNATNYVFLDAGGRRLPDPGGHYCATRMAP